MSEWKEDSNKRRDIRQCKNPSKKVTNKKNAARKINRFAVEIRTLRTFFFSEKLKRWHIHKRYSSRSRAEQAIKQLDTQYLSEDYKKRIIEV